MKIIIINGSQKVGESNTGIILDGLNKLIKNEHNAVNYKLDTKKSWPEIFKDIISCDAIVLAFPLYNDSVPSNMLKMLIELEGCLRKENKKDITVYTIINNGFYEGKQTHIAFEIIQNWCEQAELIFGGGIGQGAGEMIVATKNMPINYGPFNNLARSLKLLVEKIKLKEICEIKYLSPYFPRFLWKFMAVHTFWHSLAQKNKLKKKDILKK